MPTAYSAVGWRPNSPPQTTSVSSSRPRCFRSLSSAAIGWSVCAGVLGVVRHEVAVGVPVVVVVGAAGIDLDEPHAALDQPPGQQAARAEVARLVVDRGRTARAWPCVSWLRSTASGACCCILNASSYAGDAGGQVVLIGPRRVVPLVHAGRACRARRAAAAASCPSGSDRSLIGEPSARNTVPA